MPLLPNLTERLLFLRTNQAPGALLDVFASAGFRMAHSAIQFGVFDALSEGPRPLSELAEETGLDPHSLGILLNALANFGYVEARDGSFANTAMTEKWLTRQSQSSVADFIHWWGVLVFKFWEENIEGVLREGKPAESIYQWLDRQPRGWEIAQAGFEAASMTALNEVVDAVRLPDSSRKILDIGGGHGLYAIELCRRIPNLSAVVFDLPSALGRAHENIRRHDLAARVTTKPGDYIEDDLGDGYDAVLLFNVIHAHDAQVNTQLLRRAAASLRPSGRVFVLDQMEESAMTPMARAGIGVLAMVYLITLGASTHSFQEVRSWMEAVGYKTIRRKRILRAPGSVLITASIEPF